jgi:uncharacterized protein (DUF2344 family)
MERDRKIEKVRLIEEQTSSKFEEKLNYALFSGFEITDLSKFTIEVSNNNVINYIIMVVKYEN